jgi:peptidoglycan/LPS O-acetylase OafA/YrhL
VLELINLNTYDMKKAVIIFIVAGLIIATSILWFMSFSENLKLADLVSAAVLILVVGFALFIGFKKMSSARRGEPVEDEMSKKVMQKTASYSYYISLYLWLAIMYFSDKMDYETHVFIGSGILGMALVFTVCWLIFNFRGVRNE